MIEAIIGLQKGEVANGEAISKALYENLKKYYGGQGFIQYSPDVFKEDGEVTNESTRDFLANYMAEFSTYIARVLTVIPRPE